MNVALKIGVGVAGLAIIGGLIFSILLSRGAFEQEHTSNVVPVNGEIACLPLKDGTLQDDKDCELGLKNSRGMFLELKNMPKNLKAGDKTELKGALTSAPKDSKYRAVGVLTVEGS